MIAETIIFLYSTVIFLFTLYVLSKEDFVLLRKNISEAALFDVFFIVVLVAILFSRIFYVGFQFDVSYLNPVIFFLVPYFPGLSLVGFVFGAVLSLFIISKRKKYPVGRILDFFAISFLATLPFAYLGSALLTMNTNFLFSLLPICYYALLGLFFLKFMLPRFLSGQMRDGMIGFLILMNYSLFSAVLIIIRSLSDNQQIFSTQFFILIFLFVLSLLLYLRNGFMLFSRR